MYTSALPSAPTGGCVFSFFFYSSGSHRDLHSFPTRRSSDLVKLADTWRGMPVEYYVYRADSNRARRLFGVTPDMIEVYSQLTGVRYPWAKYAQTTVADFFGGMENVSATDRKSVV